MYEEGDRLGAIRLLPRALDTVEISLKSKQGNDNYSAH